jgi:hypothetical protein
MAEQVVKRGPGRPRKQQNVAPAQQEAPVEVVETIATPDVLELAQEAIANGVDEEEVYATIIHDPFAGKNPMRFKKHPAGRRLSWLNPKYRDNNMQGYRYVEYSSEIGKNLSQYLTEVPSKMIGSAQQDNLVRRGDSVLGVIPYGIWKARQIARESKAARNLQAVAGRGQKVTREGQSYGHGLGVDSNPTRGALAEDAFTGRGVTQPGTEMEPDEREL